MQRRLQTLSLLLCLGIGLAGASFALRQPAQATSLVALDLPELVRQSDYVVVANALRESSRYADKLIVTDFELKVITSMKGSAKPGATLIATEMGGAVDRVGLNVPGAAKFSIGRSAVVFLRRAEASDELRVVGMSQGVMPIFGNEVQTGSTQGATLMQRDPKGALVEAPHKEAQRQKLTALVAEIERLAAQ